MKTKCVATVISLSPGIDTVIESAVSLLSSVQQDAFVFEAGGSSNLPPSGSPDTPRLWSELEARLEGERKRRRCQLLLGVLDEPIENNWFSHAAFGKNVAWITAHDWEFYSDLPVVSFVAYDIVLNIVLMRLATKPEDNEWLMREVIHTEETRECISDMCAYKPDISRKIRSGKICPDCRNILKSRLGREELAAIESLLLAVSSTAISTKPVTSDPDFPVLLRMQKATKVLLEKAHDQMAAGQSRLDKVEYEKKALESKLREVEHQREVETKLLSESKAKWSAVIRSNINEGDVCCCSDDSIPLTLDRAGLAEQIERRYPFPIAYCFRSMRAELNPTDRWDSLFELYGLIIRYVVFALLSAFRNEQKEYPEELRPLVQRLKFGFAGDWGKACIALLKHWRKIDRQSFFEVFLKTLDEDNLHRFEAASRSIVQTRNGMEHGYKGDKQACHRIFERHLPDVKNMLSVIGPLAEYVLIRPVQIVDNLDGQCVYFSKIMAGSDPQFLPKQMIASTVPETVCQLLAPDGRTLTLHPWVHLNRCDSCLREMVFVYDTIQMKDGKEAVVLREYPSNHEQRQPALVTPVKKLLGV